METKHIFDIAVQTIRMDPPILKADNTTIRQAQLKEERMEKLVSFEAFLRRTAYKNTTIKTDASFFDDSDMKSEYDLVVVYEKASNTPLLSSRHYFDKSVIANYLNGDNNREVELMYQGKKFDLDNYPNGHVFLADRLSGHKSSSIYLNHRTTIFSTCYAEIVNRNRNCTLLLMVRKEHPDNQLNKYLNLGFSILGSTLHKGREHTIILRDLKNG